MGNIIIDMPNKKLQSVFEQEFGMEFTPSQISSVNSIKNSERKFRIFHEANPEVYELFKKFTFQAMSRGHKHLSAEMIINRIRWETKVVTTDKDYKINNDYKPFYSRLFIVEHPQHKDFFRLRQSVADNLGGA